MTQPLLKWNSWLHNPMKPHFSQITGSHAKPAADTHIITLESVTQHAKLKS